MSPNLPGAAAGRGNEAGQASGQGESPPLEMFQNSLDVALEDNGDDGGDAGRGLGLISGGFSSLNESMNP